MSHHLFLLSPSDTPLYSLTHQSSKSTSSVSSPLTSNLPSWTTSRFAEKFTALSGASSTTHTSGGAVKVGGGQDIEVLQMIANASLDVVEDEMHKQSLMYFRSIDKFNEWTISVFVTPSNVKLILLHESKNDDGIRLFFMDVWELYVKAAMNLFQTAHTPVSSRVFDANVHNLARKYL